MLIVSECGDLLFGVRTCGRVCRVLGIVFAVLIRAFVRCEWVYCMFVWIRTNYNRAGFMVVL